MTLVLCKIFIFGVVIRHTLCASLSIDPNPTLNIKKNQNADDFEAVNGLVEIYTFNHAKCDGMDFQGLIILTKVHEI